MEPYFITRDNAGKEVVIFSRKIVSLTEGTNDGTLMDMVNGVSIFIPQLRTEVLQQIKDSFKDNKDIEDSGEIHVM